MSFNLSISTAAHRFSPETDIASAFNSTPEKTASFDEEGPWCGTKPPGFPPPLPHQLQSMLQDSPLAKVAINPQPLPPVSEDSARLSVQSTAFDEDGPWCGTKPPGFHPPRPGLMESLQSLGLDVSGSV
jgi:hypothetical protein